MTVSIDTEYLTVEQMISKMRTALGTGVNVFDVIPFLPSQKDVDDSVLVTFEDVTLIYFWVVHMNGIGVTPFSTATQREDYGMQVFGYMSRGVKVGPEVDGAPGTSEPFASGTATGGSTTTLVDSGAAFTTNAYANSHELWATYSDGAVEHHRILSNTSTTLTIRSAQAFNTAISAGVTYEIWLRPTEWIMHEQARLVMDPITQHRSAGGTVPTGNTPGYAMEPATLYERGVWRVTFDMNRDDFNPKAYE